MPVDPSSLVIDMPALPPSKRSVGNWGKTVTSTTKKEGDARGHGREVTGRPRNRTLEPSRAAARPRSPFPIGADCEPDAKVVSPPEGRRATSRTRSTFAGPNENVAGGSLRTVVVGRTSVEVVPDADDVSVLTFQHPLGQPEAAVGSARKWRGWRSFVAHERRSPRVQSVEPVVSRPSMRSIRRCTRS